MEANVLKFEQAVKALQWKYTKAVMARIEADKEDPRYAATPKDAYDYEEELEYYKDFMYIFAQQDLATRHYIMTGQGDKDLREYFEETYWAMIKYIESIY